MERTSAAVAGISSNEGEKSDKIKRETSSRKPKHENKEADVKVKKEESDVKGEDLINLEPCKKDPNFMNNFTEHKSSLSRLTSFASSSFSNQQLHFPPSTSNLYPNAPHFNPHSSSFNPQGFTASPSMIPIPPNVYTSGWRGHGV